MAPHAAGEELPPTTQQPQQQQQQQQQPDVKQQITVKTNDVDGKRYGCRMLTNKINHGLEYFFQKVGYVVASNPWKVIAISLFISFACMAGVVELQDENRGEKNWVPQDADPIKHKEWIDEVFPLNKRDFGLLLERADGGNLLTKEGLLQLYEIDVMVRNIYNGTPEYQWNDICFAACLPTSILELWSYDKDQLSKLTPQSIEATINQQYIISPMTGRNITLARLLGSIVRNPNGSIVSASVLKMDFHLKRRDEFDSSKGLDVDTYADAWEEKVDEFIEKNQPSGYTVYTNSLRTHEKASSDAVSGDLTFFLFGYIMVICYMTSQLGSYSRIGNKVFLAVIGIGIIGISIGVAYGLGSAFQFKATGVHTVLPFLLLGIGVDDIFVLVQSWENVGGPKIDHRTIPEKVSHALKHAGVSILVTSLTDICAFAVGASTVLPALQSFSVWCAIGILAIFLLTVTLFTAILTLDARRQENKRDAILCCCKLPEDYEPMKCSQTHYLKGFLKNVYSPIILSTPGKIVVLLITAGLLASGAYGLSQLEQNFDFIWMLPPDSRPRQYTEKDRVAFPGNGVSGNVYIGQIDYYNGRAEMDTVKTALENNKYVSTGTVNSWYHHYDAWLFRNYNAELTPKNCKVGKCQVANETRYMKLLGKFLKSADGRNYQGQIKIINETIIRASQIGYKHKQFVGSVEETEALNSMEKTITTDLISEGGEPLLPFAFSMFYIHWETNKVISTELVRNIGLAGACVFVITLFLLSNLWAALMVVACVAFSLIEISAFMGFWGLAIDVVTTIIMVIAIGLTVDYSVHIAHAFMVAKGSRKDRAAEALYIVGPAVINGGTSTFLAFVFLAGSKSYIFKTFFKVFFLVVVFGLFHGLIFLPVLLSLIGPAPYDDIETTNNVEPAKDVTAAKQVELKKVTNKDEDNFVVVVENGQKNLAYLPTE